MESDKLGRRKDDRRVQDLERVIEQLEKRVFGDDKLDESRPGRLGLVRLLFVQSRGKGGRFGQMDRRIVRLEFALATAGGAIALGALLLKLLR